MRTTEIEIFIYIQKLLSGSYINLKHNTKSEASSINGILGEALEIVKRSGCLHSRECYERYYQLFAMQLGDDQLDQSLRPVQSGQPSELGEDRFQFEFPKLRILVSGIGRSGTTLIYQQIARLLRREGLNSNFRYEPYLWNIRDAVISGSTFSMSDISQFGTYVHAETPLFLERSNNLHDQFIDKLFSQPSDWNADKAPDAYLAKVVRGSGRLASYLNRFPDIKIVACLRNPFDTINSSLGMFSFFGDEFHSSDRTRFQRELQDRGELVDPLPEHAPRAIQWYAKFWRAFTEATLKVADDYPDSVFLFCHEEFRQDEEQVLNALQGFLGIKNDGVFVGLDKPAGPSIKATSLTGWDVPQLRDDQNFYEHEVLRDRLPESEVRALRKRQIQRYVGSKFSFPIAGAADMRKSPIQLFNMIHRNVKTPFLRMLNKNAKAIDAGELIRTHASKDSELIWEPMPDPARLKKNKRFGVVITCHNNSETIVEAVLSCLNQTLPYDRILVVDDKSMDDSPMKLEALSEMYSNVQILRLPTSIGPSGARHMGISQLDTDYWTQLDGDDLFWPTKNEGEARQVEGEDTVVAFSDILVVQPKGSYIQNTLAYDRALEADTFDFLLARKAQIPRDMTMSRELYFRAGGYNLLSQLYEDWEFKLRLAALQGISWHRAHSVAGTIYNRISPGLSSVDPGLHARSLVLIFLRAIGWRCPDPEQILPAFDRALNNFRARHITKAAREWLETSLENDDFDPKAIARLVNSRKAQAQNNLELVEMFRMTTDHSVVPQRNHKIIP